MSSVSTFDDISFIFYFLSPGSRLQHGDSEVADFLLHFAAAGNQHRKRFAKAGQTECTHQGGAGPKLERTLAPAQSDTRT